MTRWLEFRPCPGCGYDLVTGEGEKGCHNYDCPYLPSELDAFCPQCRFDFASMEGNPPCVDPLTCEHGEEARSHVPNVEVWKRAHAPGA
jgi:hypothetical protein